MARKPVKINAVQHNEPLVEGEVKDDLSGRLKLLGIIGGIVVLVVGGIFFWNARKDANNTKAQIELAQIRQYYSQQDFTKAIEGDPSKLIDGNPVRGLAAIVDDYGSTEAGKIAALWLGDCYVQTNKGQEAVAAYEVASGAEDKDIKAGALAKLGGIAEGEAKYAEAAGQYTEAATVSSSETFVPVYLFRAARNYEQAGEMEKAIEIYREIAIDYPTSDLNNKARLALARNNVEL